MNKLILLFLFTAMLLNAEIKEKTFYGFDIDILEYRVNSFMLDKMLYSLEVDYQKRVFIVKVYYEELEL